MRSVVVDAITDAERDALGEREEREALVLAAKPERTKADVLAMVELSQHHTFFANAVEAISNAAEKIGIGVPIRPTAFGGETIPFIRRTSMVMLLGIKLPEADLVQSSSNTSAPG